jgi:hypothetical protein
MDTPNGQFLIPEQLKTKRKYVTAEKSNMQL